MLIRENWKKPKEYCATLYKVLLEEDSIVHAFFFVDDGKSQNSKGTARKEITSQT